jgi:hypothetical protein
MPIIAGQSVTRVRTSWHSLSLVMHVNHCWTTVTYQYGIAVHKTSFAWEKAILQQVNT